MYPRQWLQQTSDWIKQAMPGYCSFCLAPALAGVGWCGACLQELPWNTRACQQCGEPIAHNTSLCGHCLMDPPAFSFTQVGLVYQGGIKDLIHDFKFHASPRAGILLSELMLLTPPSALGDAFLSVPMFPARARKRGFNQSSWLAQRLSQQLEIPLHPARRVNDAPSQRTLNRQQRAANLAGAFVFDTTPPAHVIIIDDVITTGSTGHALAQAALKAGASRVDLWAAARTPLGKD